MYHFFLHTSEIGISCALPVRKTKPNPLHADSWRSMVHIALLWRVLTWLRGGQYWKYELLKDSKSVSLAEVCTEHWQLPFMTIRMGRVLRLFHPLINNVYCVLRQEEIRRSF